MTYHERRSQNLPFARALQKLRIGSGLTPEQAAHKLKMKPGTYKAYENGSNQPSLQTFVAMCKLFKIPAGQEFKIFDLI